MLNAGSGKKEEVGTKRAFKAKHKDRVEGDGVPKEQRIGSKGLGGVRV